jgi:SNF2 family DNA or RNA helicase
MIKLYDHQARAYTIGIDFLKKHGFFAALMEMGTGKTYTSLAISQYLNAFTIVICPKSIIPAWTEQINDFFGVDNKAIFIWDSVKSKGKRYHQCLAVLPQTKNTIFIINIEAFQTTNKLLFSTLQNIMKQNQTLCILDESSKIKNPKANRTKNLMQFDFSYKMIMTGTEITNSVLDIFSQFEFLKKGFWGFRSFYSFRARYAILKEMQIQAGRTFKVVVGFQRVDEIAKRIAPYSFRIKKEQCLDLPEKIQQTVKLKMNKEQEKIYFQLKNDLYAEYKDTELTVQNKVSLFLRFRQITGGFMPESGELIGKSNPKLDFIIDDSEDYTDKFIIWCCFRAEVSYIKSKLNSCARYDGECKEMSFFQDHGERGAKYFAANMQTGAFGLNLQFCSNVYYFTRSLSLEENLQSEDRTHRIGQKNNCLYKSLVMENTIDERVNKLVNNKKNMLETFQSMSVFDIV